MITGVADKLKIVKPVPALNIFCCFLTTIFIGPDGKLPVIHTGFAGSAKGKYHEEFKKNFEGKVSTLLSKK